MRVSMSKVFPMAVGVASSLCVFALATEGDTDPVTADTIIASMGTALTAAGANIMKMVNVAVPAGAGIYASTAAVRVGKRMFKVAGGNGN